MDNYIEKNRGYITASKIKVYMKSKEAYKKVYIDEIDTSFIKKSPSLENGTIIDKFILTPEEFDSEYAILNGTKKDDLIKQCLQKSIPVDKGDKVSDLKAKLIGNKKVLTDGQVEMVLGIQKELRRQPLFDYNGKYETQKEIIVEYKGIKLKGTLDRLGEQIRDLKTTRDLEFSRRTETTKFEEKLINTDEYQYGLQLAWYAMLVYIHTGERKDGIIDAVKTTGNFAFESYFYHRDTLKRIVKGILFPALDCLLEDMEKNEFIDKEERGDLINDRYYPILNSTIQKDFRIIQPAFI